MAADINDTDSSCALVGCRRGTFAREAHGDDMMGVDEQSLLQGSRDAIIRSAQPEQRRSAHVQMARDGAIVCP